MIGLATTTAAGATAPAWVVPLVVFVLLVVMVGVPAITLRRKD